MKNRELSPFPSAAALEQDFVSDSPENTLEFGRTWGQGLQPPLVILLTGELGMGKTVLVRGLAQGLGVLGADKISSPTFTLVNSYQGRCSVHHVDLYRLDSLEEFYSIGLFELVEGNSITLIEWGERVRPWIPKGYQVVMDDLGDDRRRIRRHYFS